MKTTRLILVGGFLGAGKTTLLWEVAGRIMSQNQRVGLVTNDQAPELVDTAILSQRNVEVAEVSGSCFCCNFNGLIDALQQVRKEAEADVIVAEPVGSCTDLSATILQPIKEKMSRDLVVSPFSVLADPLSLSDILDGGTAGLHPSAAYIFQKQLEESDIVLIGKADLLDDEALEALKTKVKQRFAGRKVMTISSKTGEGIDAWLNEVMTRTDAGKRIVEVDYDKYAEGEAVLGWLNSTIEVSSESADWDAFAQSLMKDLSRQFDSLHATVGHVKIMLKSGNNHLIANLTGKENTLNFRGFAGISATAKLTLNARVEMTPDQLEQIVREVLSSHAKDGVQVRIVAFKCLSPGRPNPTYRYNDVVPAY